VNLSALSKVFLMLGCFILCLVACEKDDDFNDGPFESKRTAILAFAFLGLDSPVEGTINNQEATITLTVPFGTNRTALVPTIQISPKATISPISGLANDFTTPATYIVSAENGTLQSWTIIVEEADEEIQPRLSLSIPIWEKSPSGSGVPDFFTNNGERGVAFGNGHLYVTNNNDKILILDPADGSVIGELNTESVEGGNPKIADVEVSADGSILACNSVEWTSDGGGPAVEYKIYRWANEASEPEVFLSYANTEFRMGDSFSVTGDVSGNAVIMTAFGRKFLNPANRGNKVIKWTVTNGVLNPTPEIISVTGISTLTGFGSRPHARVMQVNSQEIMVNGNDMDFTLAALNGTFINRIPNTSRNLYDGFTSYFDMFEFAGKKVLAAAFPRSGTESRLIIIDITNGLENVTSEEVILSKNFMSGDISNANASAAVTHRKVNNNLVEVYVLITNQALVKFNLTTRFD
jgi:hypothetical protein